MMKKKSLALVLAATMMASTLGASMSVFAEEAATEAVASEATYEFNLDNVGTHAFNYSTTATSGSALEDVSNYFAQRVSDLSDGKMTVDVFTGSTLGSEAENAAAMTSGTLDMAMVAVEFYVNSIPQVGALILPYQYDDYDQVQKVLESEAGTYAAQQILDGANVKVLGYYVMAFRNMYTNKPINTVDDLAGLKMRVPESSLYVDTFTMLGAAPTPLASGEVYTAMDTGVVEGFENTADSCLNMSIFEVADYFNVTNHLNAPTTFSMSAKVFDSLNEDEQNVLLQAGLDASKYGLEVTKTKDAEFRDELKEKGMEFIESDVDSMREKIDYTAYDFMSSEEATKLFDLVQANK